jgi:hypothetical protein
MQKQNQEEQFQYTNVILSSLDFRFKVFISSEYAWFPFKLVINQIRKSLQAYNPRVKFYQISAYGFHQVDVSGYGLQLPDKLQKMLNVLTNRFFWSNIIPVFGRVFLLSFYYRRSSQLSRVQINGVKIGDILAAEYLRDPRYANGQLKLDLRFYKVVMKYLIVYALFVRDLNRILKDFSVTDIVYAIQETSFKDEMRRRVLIKKGIFIEYQFNKYLGKMRLIQYTKYAQGRVLEYTPRVNDLTDAERIQASVSMDKRVNDGVQSWTVNVTDVDPKAVFVLPKKIDRSIPTAIVFLHAVADDQYRCGLDEFASLDAFHRYTIDTLLKLGYQCILKSHPGVNSAIHPDKTIIDRRYLKRLFYDYGLSYDELISSGINDCQYSIRHARLLALHPKLGIRSIAAKLDFLTITHHGNVTFEAQHLGLASVKYRYCKNRAYHFCHDWSTISEYKELLAYYKLYQKLPNVAFKDNYLDVVAVLTRKASQPNYNKELMIVARDANIPIIEKPGTKAQVYDNFNLIQERMLNDESFMKDIEQRFSRFLN